MKTGWKKLSQTEKEVVRQCMHASVYGPFFPDWEFHTLFGVDREEVQDLLEQWPLIDDQSEVAVLAINNSFNNLLYYPHKKGTQWSEYISATPEEVKRLFNKWKGKGSSNYFDAMM